MFEVYLSNKAKFSKDNFVPFIYNNEISSFAGSIVSGEVCKIYSYNKEFLGLGFFNSQSKIMIRVLSLVDEDIDYNFFKRRISLALKHRENLNFNCMRLVFGEADYLPGLVVDKYNDILVCQFSSLGMYKIKDTIRDILVELLKPRGIYYRNDTSINEKEGIPLEKGYLYGEFDTLVLVEENDLKFYVDVKNGQKTGYFLDQKLNRDYLKHYVKDKVVLDCFSHTGGFALNALKNGAKEVTALDISSFACETIMNNAKLNGFSNINTICLDVFKYLHQDNIKDKYDIIILDPPAFTKSRDKVKNAYRGYKDINLAALKAIKKGGYLFTFSCSGHMTIDLFLEMLQEAIKDSKRMCQMVDFRIQSPDHLTLFQGLELYLKCVVIRVI